MKKAISIILSCVLFVAAFSACDTGSAPTVTGTDSATETSQTASKIPAPTPAKFTFQPKVASDFYYEVYGEALVHSWFNIVDAVLAGEDTFACPDQHTYDWSLFQFIETCFPCMEGLYIWDTDHPVKDGVGHLYYTSTKEERVEKIGAFEELTTELLNKTMKPEYTDFEKALSLYIYFVNTYKYDYEAFEKMYEEYVDYLSPYRLMTEGTGVCADIASAYSYLLMQAGVNATVMGSGDHLWSYVRINGKNYHIDPTFGLNSENRLEYFMMNDEKRSYDYSRDEYIVIGVYAQEFGQPDYVADDDTFAPLWNAYFDDFDPETHTIRGHTYNDEGASVPFEFDYSGF